MTKLNERFALVAVLGILAYWKVNNLRGVNAGQEFKSTPRNQISPHVDAEG
jgi:hypothetical protein